MVLIMDRLAEKEAEFAHIIWENEPVKAGRLARICEPVLGWKRTTVYTVLKKLCDRGLFTTEEGIVKAVISYDKYKELISDRIIEEEFGGSISGFIRAYSKNKRIPLEEAVKIYKYIEISRVEK